MLKSGHCHEKIQHNMHTKTDVVAMWSLPLWNNEDSKTFSEETKTYFRSYRREVNQIA